MEQLDEDKVFLKEELEQISELRIITSIKEI